VGVPGAPELNRITLQIAVWTPHPPSPIQHILSPGALNLRAGDFFARLSATSREPRGRVAFRRMVSLSVLCMNVITTSA
jgi:hypothetical protein